MQQRRWNRWGAWGVLLVLVVGGLALAGEDAEKPSDRLGLIVEIDDQKVEAVLGESFTVQIAGKPVRLRVTAKPTVQFRRAGIAFEYPRNYSYEHDDSEPTVTIWTLDGNNVVLMVQKYHGSDIPGSPAKAVSDFLVMRYGSGNSKKTRSMIKLGDRALKGYRVEASIAGERLVQELYDVATKAGPVALML